MRISHLVAAPRPNRSGKISFTVNNFRAYETTSETTQQSEQKGFIYSELVTVFQLFSAVFVFQLKAQKTSDVGGSISRVSRHLVKAKTK